MEVVQSYYLLLQRVHGTQRWNGTHFPDTDGTDLKMLKITVESRLPTKKKGQIQQNVRQMQRISENCQIFFEEERFDELDFFGIHRVFRRQRILMITFFCNYSSVDVTNCTTILFIYFLIGCAALSFYGINLTNDFFILYYYLRSFSCLDSSFFSSKIPLYPYIYV